MHELSLAFDLVDRAAEIARANNAKRVTMVEVAIGALSGVDRESFQFVFPEAARGSLLADARLVVVERPNRDFQFLSMEVDDV